MPEMTDAEVNALLSRVNDWPSFFRWAKLWEVEPAVMSNLRDFGGALSAEVLHQAADLEHQTRSVALARALQHMKLLEAFKFEGIPVLALKGLALGLTGYGDPSLRSFADLDLLIHRCDIADASRLLGLNGLTPDFLVHEQETLVRQGHALEFSSPYAKVELHTQLIPNSLRFELPTDYLWESAIGLNFAGKLVPALSAPAQYVFICAHGTKHEWASLRLICDAAQLHARIEADDVNEIVRLAKRANALGIVHLASQLVQAIYGEHSALDSLVSANRGTTRRLVELVRGRLGIADGSVVEMPVIFSRIDPWLGSLIYWALSRERLADKVSVIFRSIFLPTLPVGISKMNWLKRPFRLAAKGWRRFGGTVR